jgi:neutral amino acid transport system permease protein
MGGTWTRLVSVVLVVCAAFAAPTVAFADDAADAEEGFRGIVRDAEREPIEGVEILVTDADGNEVGVGVSDDEGAWLVPVPSPGEYVVTIQEDTLPEDVALRSPDRASMEVRLTSGQTRSVGFAMGEERGAAATALSRIPQSALNGVRFGLIIAMTAIGLSLVFGTTGLINFAHGEMVTFGAVVAFFLNAAGPRIPLIAAATLAAAAGGLLGGGLERGLWRPLRDRRTGLIQMLVVSIGLTLVLRHLILIVFGGRSRTYADYAVQSPMTFGPFRLTPRDLTVIVLSILILAGVAFLLQRTRLGKAMRAVADNRDLAESSGIDVKRIILVVWVLGGALAAMGGVFLGVVENVSYLMGFRLLLLMFAGVILGGLGTAFGAAVGSMVVGLVTELSTVWLASELKEMWALVVLILVLLLRPQGILGIKERIG